jgi:predicted transcriptional regulator
MNIVKNEARKLLDNMPDEASWDDVMYEMYARKKIDEGINAADAGDLIPHKEIRLSQQYEVPVTLQNGL